MSDARKLQTAHVSVRKWVRILVVLLGATPTWFGLPKLATAHVPGHEEWNDVLVGSTNQFRAPCCGLGDARLVEFDDWRSTKSGSYEVRILGRWHRIEPWKITTNEANPTGKAIVWYVAEPRWESDIESIHVQIYCFKPLDTY
jgi:hypothetical protein